MLDGRTSPRTDADLDWSQAGMTKVKSLLRYHSPHTIAKFARTKQRRKLAHEFKVAAFRIVVRVDHDLLDQSADRCDHFLLLLG